MPKAIIYIGLVLVILAMIPPALIARTRAVPSDRRRIHLIQDMDNQPHFKPQEVNTIFADGRGMRPPVLNTVARGELNLDDHYTRGIVAGASGTPPARQGSAPGSGPAAQWATSFPAQVKVDMDFMMRGQERYGIYCRPCHGDGGYGDGIVHKRANELMLRGANGTEWVQPKSLHEQAIREQPLGQVFNTITHGIRTMPAYESQITIGDRWAIVAYVRALQRSQHAKLEDVPADQRDDLRVIKLPPQAPGGEANP